MTRFPLRSVYLPCAGGLRSSHKVPKELLFPGFHRFFSCTSSKRVEVHEEQSGEATNEQPMRDLDVYHKEDSDMTGKNDFGRDLDHLQRSDLPQYSYESREQRKFGTDTASENTDKLLEN